MQTRRRVLGWIALGAAAVVAAPLRLARAAVKKLAVPLTKAEKLRQVGGWVILKIKERDILFVRDSDTTVHAVGAICTHNSCTLGYDPTGKHVVCPCHNSTFDLEGHVLTGPATKPLTTYKATLSGERVVIEVEE
jgi:cytochrome b6-f complex iron-sulfur subunit